MKCIKYKILFNPMIQLDNKFSENNRIENNNDNFELYKFIQGNLMSNYPKPIYTMFYYYSLNPLFSKDECKEIVEMGTSLNFDYQRFGTGQLDFKKFNAKRSYLLPNSKTEKIYEKLRNIIIETNNELWNFNLYDFGEPIKFMEYNEYMNGHAALHCDISHQGVSKYRKLTIIVQLTDNNDYEGGDLILQHYEKPYIMPNIQGTIIIFPSFLLHEVKPVTKGIRNSLVAFAYGPPFC